MVHKLKNSTHTPTVYISTQWYWWRKKNLYFLQSPYELMGMFPYTDVNSCIREYSFNFPLEAGFNSRDVFRKDSQTLPHAVSLRYNFIIVLIVSKCVQYPKVGYFFFFKQYLELKITIWGLRILKFCDSFRWGQLSGFCTTKWIKIIIQQRERKLEYHRKAISSLLKDLEVYTTLSLVPQCCWC